MTAGRVWYASFGSNLSYDRFLVYLTGGCASGSVGSTPGARNSAVPKRSITRFTNRRLVFAGESSRWSGGGVAFLDTEEGGDHHTALRLYDITAEQLEDVFQQENGLDNPPSIDLEAVEANGWADLANRWYGRLLCLGRHDDLPIFTITSADPLPLNPPHPNYLNTIILGLITFVDGEGFGFADATSARQHLNEAAGITPTPVGLGEFEFTVENTGPITVLHHSVVTGDISRPNSVEYEWCGTGLSEPTLYECPTSITGPRMYRNSIVEWDSELIAAPGSTIEITTSEPGGSPGQPHEQVYVFVGEEQFGPTPNDHGTTVFTVGTGGRIVVKHYSELHDDTTNPNSVEFTMCGSSLTAAK